MGGGFLSRVHMPCFCALKFPPLTPPPSKILDRGKSTFLNYISDVTFIHMDRYLIGSFNKSAPTQQSLQQPYHPIMAWDYSN